MCRIYTIEVYRTYQKKKLEAALVRIPLLHPVPALKQATKKHQDEL